MHSNIVSYSLLCKSCNGREPDSMSIIDSSESFIKYSRRDLIRECHDILFERECSNCEVKGQYAIWAIWCGERPKQIHIQLQRSNGNFGVVIWDENHNHLNHKLEQLPFTDPLCQLLSRAVFKLNEELETIVRNTRDAIGASISAGIGGDVFYTIYEESADFDFNHSSSGDVVFTENNFEYGQLKELLLWIDKNHVQKE